MRNFLIVRTETRSEYTKMDWITYAERSGFTDPVRARMYGLACYETFLQGFPEHLPENVRVRVLTCEVTGWELIA